MGDLSLIYDTKKVSSELIASSPEPVFEKYEITDERDPILTTRANDFDFGNPRLDPAEIASRIVETAIFHDVFTITANQCGLPYRIFVAGSGDEYVAFFNPEIITYSDDLIVLPETDLSNMGLMLNIKRPSSITIQYQDYTSQTKILNFSGLTARVLQQSVDRLDGIDFTTKVSKFVAERAKQKLQKRIKEFLKHHSIVKNENI